MVEVDILEFKPRAIKLHEVIPQLDDIIIVVNMPINETELLRDKDSLQVAIMNFTFKNNFIFLTQILDQNVNGVIFEVTFPYFL